MICSITRLLWLPKVHNRGLVWLPKFFQRRDFYTSQTICRLYLHMLKPTGIYLLNNLNV
jgi:hypothetical protein